MASHKGSCKHSVSMMDELCFAGVDVREHVGGPSVGWTLRRPCDTENAVHFHVNPCELYEEATQDEIDIDADLIQENVAHLQVVLPAIKKIKVDYKGQNTSGTIQCPVCKGQLHWVHHAINGHVYGRCDTRDCVHWME